MKILFDTRWINNSSPDGITRYSRELIKQLSKKEDINLLVSSKGQLADLPNIKYILTNSPTSPREINQARRLNKFGFDIVYTPHFIFGGKGRKFKLVRTVHDLIPFNQKSKDAKLAWRIFYSNTGFLKNLLNDCDGVVTVSETVKKQIKKITKNHVAVVYNAPARLTKKTQKPKKQIIYIGRYEEYKNVRVLVEAINHLEDYKLVLAGNCTEKAKAEILELANNTKQINFVGRISDSEYSNLLSTSSALILPSREEGFGLPVIEAMSVGCPVICSDIEIFREVGGDASIYFNPDSSEDLASKVRKLEDPIVRKEIIKKSLINVKRFSWIKSSNKLKSFLYEVQRGGKN